MRKIDLLGQRFGRWLVIEEAENTTRGTAQWKCLCDCGNVRIVRANDLRQGKSISCGCYNTEVCTTHGMTHHPLYRAWQNMKERCTNPNIPNFKNYGGRGITVCERWMNSFEAFYEDMSPTYKKGLSIDRRDNNKEYSPENCRWATQTEQCNNTRNNRTYELNGEIGTLTNLCRKYGHNYEKIRGRLRLGWNIEQAFSA